MGTKRLAVHKSQMWNHLGCCLPSLPGVIAQTDAHVTCAHTHICSSTQKKLACTAHQTTSLRAHAYPDSARLECSVVHSMPWSRP
eukprot:1157656-Pelagomonas_calceolata.AAC.7